MYLIFSELLIMAKCNKKRVPFTTAS